MTFEVSNPSPIFLCKVGTDLSGNLKQRRLDCNCTFCHQMAKSEIILVDYDKNDWDYILELRNKTRENFGNDNILLKKEHYDYLSKFAGKIWMVKYDNENVGFLKLNGKDLAIVLDDKMRGKHLSSYILRMGIEKTDGNLTAIIKKENVPSLKLYTNCGYKITEEKNGMVLLKL